MNLAAVVDKNGQAVDDEVITIAADAAEAGGDELQALVAGGADDPAEIFRSEGGEDHVFDSSGGFQCGIPVAIPRRKRLKGAGRDTIKTL
jgi:hypothetical protein